MMIDLCLTRAYTQSSRITACRIWEEVSVRDRALYRQLPSPRVTTISSRRGWHSCDALVSSDKPGRVVANCMGRLLMVSTILSGVGASLETTEV